eukprot:GILI01001511.1.p1 GENE.GILI01001511.1~~GILI01001511.1.p1  ORF type:complete len:430 (+),score=75.00 GILI01001511.1:84-1373(+)
MPSRSPSMHSTSRIDRLLEFYQELDPNYNPYKHHRNPSIDEASDLSSPDSLSVAGRTDSESWGFESPVTNVFSSNNDAAPNVPYYTANKVHDASAAAFAVGREHLTLPMLPSELTCDPILSKTNSKPHNNPSVLRNTNVPPPPPPATVSQLAPTQFVHTAQVSRLPPPPSPIAQSNPVSVAALPPAYNRPPPYAQKDQPIRESRVPKQAPAKIESASRYMPPPPPTLQAARVMSVVGLKHASSRPQSHPALDGRTCLAEGDFAFLTKTPGTSDWGRGGFGATYAATVAEGAPLETFTMVDIHDEAFQSLLRVLMRWYVRVAGLFGCATPTPGDAPSVNVSAARSHLQPTERLPRSYFARTAIPACPSPFGYFTTTEQGDLHIISDLQAFVAWHDAVHGWWDMHVRPRSVGHVLHKQLCQARKIKPGNNK